MALHCSYLNSIHSLIGPAWSGLCLLLQPHLVSVPLPHSVSATMIFFHVCKRVTFFPTSGPPLTLFFCQKHSTPAFRTTNFPSFSWSQFRCHLLRQSFPLCPLLLFILHLCLHSSLLLLQSSNIIGASFLTFYVSLTRLWAPLRWGPVEWVNESEQVPLSLMFPVAQ